MVKYCPKCGYPNPDNATYCLRCGAPLPAVPPAQPPYPQQPPYPTYQQPINPQQQPPQPGYPTSSQPPSYPPYQQQPPQGYPPYQQPPYPPYQQYPGRKKFPIAAVIGVVIAVVVVLVVLLVVLPLFTPKPSYPITSSNMEAVYGGKWAVLNNHSWTATFSSSGVTVSFFNGTTETVSYSKFTSLVPSNALPSNMPFNYSMVSKMEVVVFSYNSTSYGSGYVFEVIIFAKPGTLLYKGIEAINASDLTEVGFGNVGQIGNNIVYWYFSLYYKYYFEIIINKANAELIVLAGLPKINSAIASQLASYT